MKGLCGLTAGITQPIIPGVMPIQNFASFRRLVNLTKCEVPEKIMQDLEPIKVGLPSSFIAILMLISVRRRSGEALWCPACNDHGLSPRLVRDCPGSALLHAQSGEIRSNNLGEPTMEHGAGGIDKLASSQT